MTDEKSLTVVEQRLTARYPSLQQWQLFEKFALVIQDSREFSPKSLEEVIIKAQYCWDYGLPLSAFSSLYIISKRVAIQSDLIAEKMLDHPDFEYDVGEHTDDKCEIIVWRRSKRTGEFEKAGISVYTMEDARREGNDQKEPYKRTPRNMMFARAITNAYKWYARNIFNMPVNTIEEFGYDENTIEAEFQAVETKPVEPILINDDTGEVLLTKQDVIEVSDIPNYGIADLAGLLKLASDKVIKKAMGRDALPILEDEINLCVHVLVETGILEVAEDGFVLRPVEIKEDEIPY